MLFSIIVPVYNVEKYLNKCIDSIISQTFKDYELILVNDGSKDSSDVICDDYAKKYANIKVIHQENAGQAVARNVGTEMAEGQYIVYLDSDDYIGDVFFLQKLCEKTTEQPDVVLYGYKKLFENTGKFSSDICAYPNVNGVSPEKTIELLLETDMYDGSPWSKTVRTSFLKDNKISFVPGMISEDSDWFLQVVTQAKTYDNINEPFIIYRQRDGSVSHAPKLKSLTDNLFILEKWKNHFDKNDLPKEFKKVLMSVLARYYANVLVLYTRFSKKEVSLYYKKVKQLQYLLKYSATKRARMIKSFCLVFGLKTTLLLLKVLDKIRG